MPSYQDVYEIFKEYYGEDKVDLQYENSLYKIIVWFPTVVVTNEYNESIIITDLYVKTRIDSDGCIQGPFHMTRGSYTKSQVRANYLHSHVIGIPEDDNNWMHCCLGTGPINRTISLLANDNDLDRWRLYCYELDKYVHTESVEGIPYRRLNRVSVSSLSTTKRCLFYENLNSHINFSAYSVRIAEHLGNFVTHMVNNEFPLKFTYLNDHYSLAHSFLQVTSILTTEFLKFNNNEIPIRELISSEVLLKGTFEGDYFISKDVYNDSYYRNVEGLTACTFKGNPVIVTVIDDLVEIDDSRDVILHPTIVSMIVYKILAFVNYGTHVHSDTIDFEKGRAVLI